MSLFKVYVDGSLFYRSNPSKLFLSALMTGSKYYLRMICNEIFGKNNFLTQFVWQKRTSPDMRKLVSTAHEYVCTYCKDISYLPNAISKVTSSEEDVENYKNPDNDPRGPWVSSDFTAQGFRPNQMHEIITPGGARYTPPEGRCWKM